MPILLETPSPHLPGLVRFWNDCSVDPFWMDETLMRQYLMAPNAAVWVEGSPWRGVLWGRLGDRTCTLDALWVQPQFRRQGIGSRLLASFRAASGSERAWRFGGGEHHFVPGLPTQLSDSDHFFQKHRLIADWHAHDLLWSKAYAESKEWAWDQTVYQLVDSAKTEPLGELLSHFGIRWQHDTAARCHELRVGEEEEIMGVYCQHRLIGFCHIWSPRSHRLGPSTFWLARENSRNWGGIGPLGVHPEMRGRGYGAGVVKASLAHLQSQGAELVGVDWTGLPDFYEGCGFRRWLDYRGYHPQADRGSGNPEQ